MELVTEPVIHSAEEAVAFAKELQLTLQYLGVAEANMEKGEMRVEANISVSSDKEKFGTKVEVKNLNSFKAVEKAIRYELDRHIEVLENGEKIIQETRGWDEKKETTFSQRQKEESHDYRYFPDPDLPKLYITEIPEFAKNNLQKEIGELPDAKRERYKKDFGLKENDIEIFIQNASWGRYFEAVLKHLNNNVKLIQLASNYITSDLWGMVYGDVEFNKDRIPSEATFAELIKMIGDSKITSRGAKDTLAIMYKEGGSPEAIALKHGFIQKNDEGELKEIVEKIVAGNPKVVEDFKAGKAAALQFLIGQGMKETKGSANPEILKRIFTEVLG
jgi:aspartyl-tRNA(Asn)/glutamyl-tRNA(Gln) amidotransferase subunit B